MKILISATKMQGYVYFMSYRGDGNFMCHTKMQDDANVVLLGVMEICCATKEGDGNFMCKVIETTKKVVFEVPPSGWLKKFYMKLVRILKQYYLVCLRSKRNRHFALFSGFHALFMDL